MSTHESAGSNESDVAAGGEGEVDARGRLLRPDSGPRGAGVGHAAPPPPNNNDSVFNRTLRDLDPVLRRDPTFQDEMRKLDALYEAKLASLRAAREESRRRIVISAMVRNRRGVSVGALMESAAARGDVKSKARTCTGARPTASASGPCWIP